VALDRYGKYIMLRPERIDRIEAWIGRRGTPILMYGPLVPILRAYVPALAGMFGVPYRLYIFILAGAAAVWSFGLLILGQVLGDHWWDAIKFFRNNLYVGVILVLGAALIGYIWIRIQRRAGTNRAQHWPETVLPPPHRIL
jgi:membrane protein DedA with SNARE-associated domain